MVLFNAKADITATNARGETCYDLARAPATGSGRTTSGALARGPAKTSTTRGRPRAGRGAPAACPRTAASAARGCSIGGRASG
eukprot:5327595-Lingulodinium_polyedra.AAC.1